MAVISVNSDSFRDVVLSSDKPVLVDFWATWCGPCRMLGPVIEAFSEKHPEIVAAKVNIDECPELAMLYRVTAVPAILLFKNGAPVKTALGYQSFEALEALLQ